MAGYIQTMEGEILLEPRVRPLVGRLENADHDDPQHRSDGDPTDSRLIQLLGDFFRGDKEKRRRLLEITQKEAESRKSGSEDESDIYEPQRITRKIHWQYDRSMKKVPMLRRDYIG